MKNKLNNVLIVSDKETYKNIFKSTRNIRDVKLIIDEGANLYDLFKFKNVFFTQTSIKNIQKRLTDEKN
jgi:ribosomal protein L4